MKTLNDVSKVLIMNGTRKFHKANGSAFNVGEQWRSVSGKILCKIVSVRKYKNCDGKWDYDVTYEYEVGVQHTKDAWNFQIRYQHIADEKI